ncbi:MAG: DUF3175 domain-containing protein [Rhizobium sp.]|nr:DUF3175 domain-containing protein [Rhizobium sp.]
MNSTKPRGASAGRGRWSQQVTARSNALDLEPGVFRLDDPHAIALLKRKWGQTPLPPPIASSGWPCP